MELTRDNIIQEQSENIYEPVEKPYLKKEMLFIEDSNGGTDYGRGIVKFETVALSNNGMYHDYKNAYVSVPLVGVLHSDQEITTAEALTAFNLKSSHLNLVDSCSVKYGNSDVIQSNAQINSYLIYKQHVKMSQDDVNINADTVEYRKDLSDTWKYAAVEGISNSFVGNGYTEGGLVNANIKQKVTSNVHASHGALTLGRNLVLSDNEIESSGVNYIEKVDATAGSSKTWVYYFDCIIMLKDLPFFGQLPLLRGSVIQITLQMNQASSVITYGADGVMTNAVHNLQKNTNPMLRCRSVKIDAASEYMSLKIVKNDEYEHPKKKCRLYVAGYNLNPVVETRYLSLGQKEICYEDYVVQKFQDIEKNFSLVITQSLSHAQQLVICPTLSMAGNGGKHSAIESVFACEPSVCSPYLMKNFQCVIGGRPLYPSPIDYKYEQFLDELNGVDSFDANMTPGNTSGQISMKDYMETYGYIVVDLSRRYDYDNKTATSYKITGIIESLKKLDLLCFISYTKCVTIDLNTGGLIRQD